MENNLKEKVDVLHTLKIALVHDLVEVYTGDVFHFYKDKKKSMIEEEIAAKKLKEKLPEDIGDEIYNLWKEFEEMKTSEAKLVQALDKLDPVLQDLPINSRTHKDFKLTFEQVLNDKITHLENNKDNELLLEIYRQVLNEFKKQISL
jgi:putative hydrolase of HD superfamily